MIGSRTMGAMVLVSIAFALFLSGSIVPRTADPVPVFAPSDEYTVRGEIRITGDDELIDAGFPGSGTLGDPYRIEWYDLPDIRIYQVSLHVVVSNCKTSYITVSMSENTVVENCEIFERIVYMDCGDNTAQSNNISQGYIYLYSSSGLTVHNNTLGLEGIRLRGEESPHWQHDISNNTAAGESIEYITDSCDLVLDPDTHGMLLMANCTNCTITGGEASSAGRIIYLGYSRNCTISSNLNHYVTLNLCSNMTVSHNRGNSLHYSGVDLLTCEGVRVFNNTFWDNEMDGIAVQKCTDCLVENNTVTGYTGQYPPLQGSGYGMVAVSGINLFVSQFCVVRNNSLMGNPRVGINQASSTFCDIRGNTICDTSGGAISGRGNYCNISSNAIFRNEGAGISFVEAVRANITFNLIYGHNVGIDITSDSYNTTILNNTIDSSGACISTRGVSGLVMANNTLIGGGILLSGSRWGADSPEDYHIDATGNTLNGSPIGYRWGAVSESIDVSGYAQMILCNSQDVTLSGGRFVGCVAPLLLAFCNGTSVYNTSVSKCSIYGISLIGCRDCTLSNCTMEDCGSVGQRTTQCESCLSTNCTYRESPIGATAHECVDVGWEDCVFRGLDSGVYLAYSQWCKLTKNEFADCSVDIVGIRNSHWNHSMMDNTVNGRELGYFLGLSGGTVSTSQYGAIIITLCDQTIFSGGNFSSATLGVLMGGCSNCTLQGITSSSEKGAGVKLSSCWDCEIVECECSDNQEFGIEIGNTGSYTGGTTIVDSILDGNGNGIRVTYDDCTSIINTRVCNNVDDGIIIYYADNATISDCNITGNGAYGIAGAHCFYYGKVTGSNISHNGVDGIGSLDLFSLASDNLITDNGRHGISLSGFCTVSENQIHRNGASGVVSFWAHNATISWNHICNNTQFGVEITDNSLPYANYGMLVYGNSFLGNVLGNALDNGMENAWDDGYVGNAWQDWSGSGVYPVPGSAGSVDHHPWQYGGEPPEYPPVTTTTTTSTETVTTTSSSTGGTTTSSTEGGTNDSGFLVPLTIGASAVVIVLSVYAIIARWKRKSLVG